MNIKWGLLLGATLIASASTAHANLIGVGPGDQSPDVFGALPGGSVIASIINAPFVSLAGASDFSGIYSTEVIKEGGGTLDFAYWFSVDPTAEESIDKVTAASFKGFTTDVGYVTGGGVVTSSVDRITAAPVDFNFADGVSAGGFSDILLVRTNATRYKAGSVAFIDSGVAFEAAFAPTVPEASTWAMLVAGFAMLGLAGARKRAVRFAV